MGFSKEELNMKLEDLVPPTSETITELLRMGYSLYAEIRKTFEGKKNDEVDEFAVKHETNIFQLIASNVDHLAYTGKTLKQIKDDNTWKNIALETCNDNMVRIRHYDNSIFLDKDNLGYPDYLKVFYWLRQIGIFPSKGRIISVLIFSATENIRLNPTHNFDLPNALYNVPNGDIKYLDFLPLVEKEVEAVIKVSNVKMMLPKIRSLNLESYKNWEALLKNQLGVVGTYESYNVDIEEEE